MSSTILYLAIVAIWAGVLVPRWLRREPHRDASSRSRSRRAGMSDALATSVVLTAGGAEFKVAGSGGQSSVAEAAFSTDDAEARRSDGTQRSDGAQRSEGAQRPDGAQRRTRVVNARRRLLGVLVVLATVATTIAIAHLAAWWVVVPPAGMLVGYLILLREAAHADAELNQARRPASQAGKAMHRARRAAPTAAAGLAAEPVMSAATAGTAQILDITERVSEEIYDQYADAKLRAVGD